MCVKQRISLCVDNTSIQSDLCPGIHEISVKQSIGTTWLFPLWLSPLVPWSVDPSRDQLWRRHCGLQGMRKSVLSVQPSLLGPVAARSRFVCHSLQHADENV